MFHVKHRPFQQPYFMKIKDCFLSQEVFETKETETKGVFKTYPIPKDIGAYYNSKNYISHHQDSSSFKDKVYKFFQRKNLIYKKKILPTTLSKKSVILDYGFGAGEFLKFIENDFTTIGFEPNEVARKNAENKLLNTNIISDTNILENESIDVISLWHVFEHIENQQEIIDTFYAKLKSGGKLIIAVPNINSYDAKYYKEFWAAYDVPRHIYHFTKEGIANLFNNEKWNVENIQPLYFDSFYISLLSEKYKNPKNIFSVFRAFCIGLKSNQKAKKTGEYSSLIYIINKL